MVVELKGNDPNMDVDVNLTKIRFVNKDAVTLKAGSPIKNENVVKKESDEPNNMIPNESNNIDELQLKNVGKNIVEFKKNNENNCNNKANHGQAAMSPQPTTTRRSMCEKRKRNQNSKGGDNKYKFIARMLYEEIGRLFEK